MSDTGIFWICVTVVIVALIAGETIVRVLS